LRALEARGFPIPSNTAVPAGTRREQPAEVAKTVPPQKKIIKKNKKELVRYTFLNNFFFPENLGHYSLDNSGWLQGTSKGTGLKRPSLAPKPLLMSENYEF